MATEQSKVLRISHNQLSKLAQKYDNEDVRSNEARHPSGKRSDRDDRDRHKRGKRPDMAIYRPGSLRNPRSNADNSEADDFSSADNLSGADRGSSAEKDMEELRGGVDHMSMDDNNRRPRRKKPDIPIYVPKHRQQQDGEDWEAELQGLPPGTSPSSQSVYPIHGTYPAHDGSFPVQPMRGRHEGSPAHWDPGYAPEPRPRLNSGGQRRMDEGGRQYAGGHQRYSDSRRSQDNDNKPPSGRGNDNQRRDRRPRGERGRGGGRGGRGRNRPGRGGGSGGNNNDANYFSDASHDSLEWDYQGDVEQGFVEIEDNMITTEVFTNSKYATAEGDKPPITVRVPGRGGRSAKEASKERQVLFGHMVNDKDNEMEWDEMDEELAGAPGTPGRGRKRKPRRRKRREERQEEGRKDGEKGEEETKDEEKKDEQKKDGDKAETVKSGPHENQGAKATENDIAVKPQRHRRENQNRRNVGGKPESEKQEHGSTENAAEDEDEWVSEEEMVEAGNGEAPGSGLTWGDMVEAELGTTDQAVSMDWGAVMEAEIERQEHKDDSSVVNNSKTATSPSPAGKTVVEPYRPPAYRNQDAAKQKAARPEKSRHGSGDQVRKHGRGRGSRDRLGSRERPGSQEKERPGSKPNLKVTFAQNERQVKVTGSRGSEEREAKGRRGRGREEGGMDIHGDGRGRGRKGAPTSPKGNTPPSGGLYNPPRGRGGIIHLPVQHGDRSKDGPPHNPPTHSVSQGRPHNPRGRGRGSGSRTLYDPNNPNKQMPMQAPLHFQDAYDQAYSPPAYPHPNYDYHVAMGRPGYEQPYQQDYSTSPHGHGDLHGYGFPHPAYEVGSYQDDVYSMDPYYHSGGHDVDNSSRGRSSSRSEAEAILRKVVPLDGQLTGSVARGFSGVESFSNILRLRQEVQFQYEQVILMDPDLANRHNVEHLLWKAAFYTIIEALRRHDQEHPEDHANRCLLQILDEGVVFYQGLLKKLQSTYSFSIDAFLDPTRLPVENLTRNIKLALLSTQRTFISLGDIARYSEQANRTCNYGLSRSLYLKAQQIAPKNGRPYNQLAILALYTRRKLDAVYYYMRSLAASNPFLTARQSLMALFEDARKRMEVQEQKKLQEEVETKDRQRKNSDGSRVEIWILPDGTSSDGQDDNDIRHMSTVELNKRFTLSFLHVHGKLFTKIGMESFPEVSSQMLSEFEGLLQRSPPPLAHLRLLQLMAINMFAIENTTPKDNLDDNCRTVVQEQAVRISLDMAGLLLTHCAQLFQEHLASGDCRVMSDELHGLFPSVKVWADWMTCHYHLWNPPPLPRDPTMGPSVDVWQSVAHLCNMLRQVDISHVKLYKQKKEGCDPVILEEDVALSGFVPLLSVPRDPTYVHSTVDKEVSRNCLRVELLRLFGDYLCGIEPPMLEYNVGSQKYISVTPDSLNESTASDLGRQVSKDSDDVIIESEEEEVVTDGNSEEFQQLKAKHSELQRTLAAKEEQHRRVAAVLQDSKSRQHILEISPVFLVPDTNCFIDHLMELQALLARTSYILVVPLVVINELDGLAKGQREGQYLSPEHGHMVTEHAQMAMAFLEGQFESRNGRLRALTSKGTTLNTIVFRSEETAEEGNNDDLILQCCLHYCKDKARDFMPKDREAPIRIRREVVLLTEDRNLRVKAHTRNVPVKDILSFLKWVKVT